MRSGRSEPHIYAQGEPSAIRSTVDLCGNGSPCDSNHGSAPGPATGTRGPRVPPALPPLPRFMLPSASQRGSHQALPLDALHPPVLLSCYLCAEGQALTHLHPKLSVPGFLSTSPLYPRTSVIISKILTKP